MERVQFNGHFSGTNLHGAIVSALDEPATAFDQIQIRRSFFLPCNLVEA